MYKSLSGNVIIIPFGQQRNWLADYEIQTANILAKRNTVVIVLPSEGVTLRNALTKRTDFWTTLPNGIQLFKPFYPIPFQRFRLIRRINFWFAGYFLRKKIATNTYWAKRKKIFWAFSLQHSIFPQQFIKEYLILFDCVDNATSEDPTIEKVWTKDELEVIQSSHIVFANSQILTQLMQSKHHLVFQVPIGFDDRYVGNKHTKGIEKKFQHIPKPRICFSGHISKRIDFELLLTVIHNNPRYSFVFIGNEDPGFPGWPKTDYLANVKKLKKFSNVYMLGSYTRKNLSSILKCMDIGIVPYDTTQRFNMYSFPMKIMDYFAAGLPTISTPIQEIKRLSPLVTIVQTAKEMQKAIDSHIRDPKKQIIPREQKKFVIRNSWENKIREISRVLHDKFPDKVWYK